MLLYRGRLVHSALLRNANIMQIQTMTQMQTKNPAASFIKAICNLFKITIEWKMKHAAACFSAKYAATCFELGEGN